jgi:hypothetical protein
MNVLHLQRARIRFAAPRFDLSALAEHLRAQIAALPRLVPGSRVAVGVGSRGIANLREIVRLTIAALRSLDLDPFVFPAMGSHGGATAEGQVEVLAGYGVTEGEIGCRILATMEVVELDSTGLEHPLYMDAHAAAADAVLLVNRIKPHTDFHGSHESGLVKMAVIGLGKRKQADAMHSFGVRGLRDLIPLATQRLIAAGRLWGGVGVVENALDETMLIEAIAAERMIARETELLAIARSNMPRLPVNDLDVLIVDRMGKDISGCGMDTNILGRLRIAGQPEPAGPRIWSVVVCDLTEGSHGNAAGIGLADVITERLRAKVDVAATHTNVVTSGFLERGKTPVTAATDSEAFDLAVRYCCTPPMEKLRVIRIRDTLHLGEVMVSAAVARELRGRDDVELVGELVRAFEGDGALSAWPGVR